MLFEESRNFKELWYIFNIYGLRSIHNLVHVCKKVQSVRSLICTKLFDLVEHGTWKLGSHGQNCWTTILQKPPLKSFWGDSKTPKFSPFHNGISRGSGFSSSAQRSITLFISTYRKKERKSTDTGLPLLDLTLPFQLGQWTCRGLLQNQHSRSFQKNI